LANHSAWYLRFDALPIARASLDMACQILTVRSEPAKESDGYDMANKQGESGQSHEARVEAGGPSTLKG
jgi:hypothetical protein